MAKGYESSGKPRGNPSLKKGVVMNPAGRPKGSANVKTEKWHILCSYLMDEGTERLMASMDQLDPKEFVEAYCKILNYIKPKLTNVDTNSTEGIKIIIQNETLDNEQS
jgi:hypothetical protein